MLSATTELLQKIARVRLELQHRLTEDKSKRKTVSNNMLPTSVSFQLLGQIRHREVSLLLAYFKALRMWRTGNGPATQASRRNETNN